MSELGICDFKLENGGMARRGDTPSESKTSEIIRRTEGEYMQVDLCRKIRKQYELLFYFRRWFWKSRVSRMDIVRSRRTVLTGFDDCRVHSIVIEDRRWILM